MSDVLCLHLQSSCSEVFVGLMENGRIDIIYGRLAGIRRFEPFYCRRTYAYVRRVGICYRTLSYLFAAAELLASNFRVTLLVKYQSHIATKSASIIFEREFYFEADFMKLCWFPVFFMSLASPLVHCLKLTRSKSILSRFAVPITLVVINTFMMSTSAEGAHNFKSFCSMPTKISDLT
jgi:hypothetical protein